MKKTLLSIALFISFLTAGTETLLGEIKFLSKLEKQKLEQQPELYDIVFNKNYSIYELLTKLPENSPIFENLRPFNMSLAGPPSETDLGVNLVVDHNLEYNFPQSFFKGYIPKKAIAIDDIFEIANFIGDNIEYTSDMKVYGLDDVWQTSTETMKKGTGDCEDFSILLADWLVSLGIDARVVVGLAVLKKGEGPTGHAWVVVFHNGEKTILEPTAFKWVKKGYKLNVKEKLYFPQIMFNNKYTWTNHFEVSENMYDKRNWLLINEFIAR